MDNWQVRNISNEATEEIRLRAEERGLTIGQYLEFVFCGQVDSQADTRKKINLRREYKVRVAENSWELFKKKAKEKGYGVGRFVEILAEQDFDSVIEDKLDRIRDIVTE